MQKRVISMLKLIYLDESNEEVQTPHNNNNSPKEGKRYQSIPVF